MKTLRRSLIDLRQLDRAYSSSKIGIDYGKSQKFFILYHDIKKLSRSIPSTGRAASKIAGKIRWSWRLVTRKRRKDCEKSRKRY